ncbi:MAG: TIGR02452 family protein [Lentisphaeria bacterium]|nr:TIGR02452 family protein [Lentisphaeria bacterium]
MMKEQDVSRFEKMYDLYFPQVAQELRGGRKESHWMWFIFPQIKGLGRSETSVYYALRDLEEAKAFLASSCGERMENLLEILLAQNNSDPAAVFGGIDSLKLASSMTLFAHAAPEKTVFRQILEKFYSGKEDEKTLRILADQDEQGHGISSQDFLKKFLPAYERGDTGTLHELRRRIFRETMEIARTGSYETPSRRTVTLPDPQPMMKDSILYSSVEPVNLPERPEKTVVEVCDSDSFLAGKKLLDEGFSPAVLNFANRYTPGGGVLRGSGAQEENLFRRSTLALSLYQFHGDGELFSIPQRKEQYPMNRTSGGAYSPDVTVFRGTETEGYPLLEEPYHLAVITVAALNRPELKNPYEIADHLVEAVREKMRTIFRIALKHGHDALVLGAWGCGAFKNPPQHIAKLFHGIMEEEEFRNRFRKIVFAVMDRRKVDKSSSKVGNFLPFREEFTSPKIPASAVRLQEDKAERFRRFKGMFWGLVTGDCLGSPVQFMGKDEHPYITEMVRCASFGTPPGYWTDDSSMAFCVAASFVRLGKYDLADIADNFVRWYRSGFWSSLSRSFDVGRATKSAIYRMEEGSLRNGEESSQGNGSIMRLAPSYIIGYGKQDRKILHEISDLTHDSARVRETVDLMKHICDEHMLGEPTRIKSLYTAREEVNNSGWAVSTLHAALWALETTKSFEEGMIAAVNLGGDADTIGAVFGQIAGALYGYDAIPERWLSAIKDREKINELIESLILQAER